MSPTLISHHDPKVVYAGGNRLFISRDRGLSWERTDDLTRRIDRDTLRLMGVRGSDIALSRNDGESSFGAITTIAESPLDPMVLWVGTDDGNVQASRDGGRTWAEVSANVRGVRSGTWVSRVIASRTGPGVAYVTFDAHRDGDFAPYVFRTEDFGRTWTPRVTGLPSGSVNVIVEHQANPSVLFLGTEHALFASNDAGATWVRFMPNLPTTLYDDIEIHPRDNDLVLATHGRSIWILDNLTPLIEWSATVAAAPAHLFPVRATTIFQYWKDSSYRGQGAYAGENPPFGAILDYYLAKPVQQATITVADASGQVVRRLDAPGSGGVIHRVTWDLRHEPPPSLGGGPGGGGGEASEALPALAQSVGPRGPFVSPGTYTVTLEAGGARSGQRVVVRGDPMMPVTEAQYREREAFLVALEALQLRAAELARQAGVRAFGGFGPRAAPAPGDSLAIVRGQIGDVLRGLNGIASDMNGSGVRSGSLYPPTETQKRRRADLEATLNAASAAWARVSGRR